MTNKPYFNLRMFTLAIFADIFSVACSVPHNYANPIPYRLDDPPSSDQKTGIQLWSENCAQCHNIPHPKTYSPAQWGLVVHHMRVRAALDSRDAEAIAVFLKSGK